MLLAVTDENLIAGKVGEILEDEAQISMLLDVGLNALEEPIMMALTAFSSSIGKELEEPLVIDQALLLKLGGNIPHIVICGDLHRLFNDAAAVKGAKIAHQQPANACQQR